MNFEEFKKYVDETLESVYSKLNEEEKTFISDLVTKFNQKCEENQTLKEKYNKVLSILAQYSPPCELDGFMDKNVDYCSMNCGVDEEVFKECWNRYIEQKVKGEAK